MRLSLALLMLSVLGSCRTPRVAEPIPDPPPLEKAGRPAPGVETSPPATTVETSPRPAPVLTFVGDGWVRDADDPDAPMLRFTGLRPSADDDAAPVRALLGVLEPLMVCYETELASDPALRATLSIRRQAPRDPTADDIDLHVQAPHETALASCARPLLSEAMPALADDPHGRYAIAFFAARAEASRLQEPRREDETIEREGGSCWTWRTYPCAPHKMCKAAEWERTACRHPADKPGVALRWAFGPADEQRWPIVGLDLVGLDDGLVWRTPLEDADATRLGNLHVDDARRHIERFREHPPPGTLWTAIEPTRVMLADRAGVRVHDRRTGKARFRYSAPDAEASRMWFDGGEYLIRRGKRRCKGDAGHGAFAVVCGKDLVYFDGYALAVIAVGDAVYLRDSTTLAEPSSSRSGGAVRPKATLKAGRYRLSVEGMVFMQ